MYAVRGFADAGYQSVLFCIHLFTHHPQIVLVIEFLTTFVAASVIVDSVFVEVAYIHGSVIATAVLRAHVID